MISPPERARPRRAGESYEEKCERRQETREALRRRGHAHSTRRPGRIEEQTQSPRQREFLRRRNLGGTAEELSAPILLQRPWSHPVCPSTLPPLGLSSPTCILAEAIPGPHTSTSTRGTQTPASTRLKDSGQQTDCGNTVFSKEIVQLSGYLKEALHRELLLKQKMVILQELLATLLHASEKSWQGQLNEDKLKCKLRALENQLQACTQSYSKECVKKILIEMEDQKQTYEQKAKEALQKMLEDKLQAEQQLQNSQRCLAVTREDLALWKEHYTMLKSEWSQMAKAHSELKSNLHTLQSQLQHMATQNEELCQALDLLQHEHAELQQHADNLQQDNQLQAKQIRNIEGKLQKEQNQKLILEATISQLHNLMQNQTNEQKTQDVMVQRKDQVFTMQTPPLTPAKEMQNVLSEHPKEKAEESLRDEIKERTSQLTAKEKEVCMGTRAAERQIPPRHTALTQCQELRAELEALSEEYRCCLSRLHQCRQELNQSQTVKTQRGNWLPLLLAVIVVATAAVLAMSTSSVTSMQN
uniref:TRAF3 interacting protein 3 n=1 Tax=Coturnix japonica TaxID=93934 RepID=A0A8C2U202_COTJA